MISKCQCGRIIPDSVTKCFKCATAKKTPMSEATYRSLEYDRVHDTVAKYVWPNEWQKAYILNRMDMALIIKDKQEFLIWGNKLKMFMEAESNG